MKRVIFLVGGLLLSLTGIAQTTTAFPVSGIPEDAGINGINNVHIGAYAGTSNYFTNTGHRNVFVGYESGYKNQTGYDNTFLGYQAGKFHFDGNSNIFLGSQSGRFNTGDNNVFVGSKSGRENTSGRNNTFCGYQTGINNLAGEENIFLGYQSGLMNLDGSSNIYLGSGTGYSNINGLGNTFLGRQSGYSNLGSFNVFLGYQAGYNELYSNKLYIANSDTSYPLVYGEFDNKNLKFNANKVGIGTEFGDFPTLTFDNAENYKLFVRGGILAEEVRIRLQTDWADYVFMDGYKLLSLKETEDYINKEGHLPNMPSAQQVSEEGLELGNIIKLQQEKIEELTLYVIEQDKQIQLLKEQNKELDELKEKVELLLKKQ